MVNKWVVICCPVSGKKDAVSVLERDFFPKTKDLGLDVEMVLTTHQGHATELAKQYGDKDTGIIAVGGDGTIHEVMDGLIEKKVLDQVVLGLLSQGTMNFYWHSARLPNARELPALMKANSYRPQSLMRAVDNSGMIDTRCFEAVYLGVGYRPAKGAQEWRNTFLGPMFGILFNLVKCNMFPASSSIRGTLTMYPRDGSKPIEVKDDFFWIVVTQRSPYNGTLTPDEMWVSYITLKAFPGFGRMMDSFAPPMECQSGLVNLMENNVNVSKVVWKQEVGKIGVCLDGDPMDAGTELTLEHIAKAWNIVAEKEFPKRVADAITKPCDTTECAKQWLSTHPVPEGVFCPMKPPPTPPSIFSHLKRLIVGGAVLGALAVGYIAATKPDLLFPESQQ